MWWNVGAWYLQLQNAEDNCVFQFIKMCSNVTKLNKNYQDTNLKHHRISERSYYKKYKVGRIHLNILRRNVMCQTCYCRELTKCHCNVSTVHKEEYTLMPCNFVLCDFELWCISFKSIISSLNSTNTADLINIHNKRYIGCEVFFPSGSITNRFVRLKWNALERYLAMLHL